MKIALITYQDQGAYHNSGIENEDELLISFLKSKNLAVEKVIWNNREIIWESYDLAIVKSPWDYFDLITDFYNWLDDLKSKNIKLLNPIDIIKWNADKHYLNDIAQAGLKVTPSLFLTKAKKESLNEYFNHFNTDKLVVKPVVSGGSKHTFMVTTANVDEVEQKLEGLLATEDFIIQPFLSAIETEGEWSFIFFGGKFSHALLKKAKPGDFRVQSTFGGTVHPQIPSPQLLVQAQKYVDQFAKNCLYARVDGTVIDQEFMLMELELIEPFLFLTTNPESFEHYYKALINLIR